MFVAERRFPVGYVSVSLQSCPLKPRCRKKAGFKTIAGEILRVIDCPHAQEEAQQAKPKEKKYRDPEENNPQEEAACGQETTIHGAPTD